MQDIHQILNKYWGYTEFRTLQKEIIKAVLEHKDVLALLPTGGGKSICFQVPALARPGICLVISPLIALMKDQIEQLKKRGIPGVAIFTGMSYAEIDLALDNCIYGNTKFLYISPERLKTDIFQTRVQKMQVNLLAIDEAHCISQWGYDFRPAYLDIAQLRPLLGNTNVIALTATATKAVKQDIQDKLEFKNAIVFQKSFTRKNLAYIVKKTDDKQKNLLKLLSHINGSSIIYVNTRKKTKSIAQFLEKHNINTTFYHGGLSNEQRTKHQDSWIKGETNIIIATNAFGMGVDKPDVRLVIHLDLPTSLEAYYQEAGRAGRDEKKAYAIILYDEQDIIQLQENIQKENPTIEQIKMVYQNLANYYQLAIGSHNTKPYEFDLMDFANKYKLAPREAYHAIKKLANQDIIALNEGFSISAKLYITVSTHELYAFQVAHINYEAIIKAILRLYGGELFTDFCNISENQIARYLNINIKDLKKQLKTLEHLGIIIYCQQTDKPHIIFTQPRYHITQIPLNTKDLVQKAKINMQKAEAVINYVTHKYRCRPQILLEYFDEISYQPCNLCDICLSKKNQDNIEQNQCIARKLILDFLQKNAYELNTILDNIHMPQEIIINTIRKMLDEGQLAYDNMHRLRVT